MKKINLLTIALVLGLTSCKDETKPVVDSETVTEELTEKVTKEVVTDTTKVEIKSFGKEIIAADALTGESMLKHYKGLKVGDSIDAKITAKVLEVCKKKDVG